MSSPRLFSLLAFTLLLSVPMTSGGAEYRGVRVIAHRGAGHEFDENTIEGCRQSFARGIRGFEVDLRLTRDDRIVLSHDSDVSRTTNGTGKIEEMTFAEVQQLRTKQHGVRVPALEDLLAYFQDKPEVVLLLEMKTTEEKVYTAERLATYCRLLHEATRGRPGRGNFWFTSFDRRSLAEMKRLAPEAHTGLLTSTAASAELIATAKELGCERLSVSLDGTSRKLAREVRGAGLQLSLWPIKTVEDANLAVLFEPSILCTDIPSQLLPGKTAAP